MFNTLLNGLSTFSCIFLFLIDRISSLRDLNLLTMRVLRYYPINMNVFRQFTTTYSKNIATL